MFETDKWRQPYHATRAHPRRDLTMRYLEIVVSIAVAVFASPYVFRVSPSVVQQPKYHTGPDASKNVYFVLSLLFGFIMTVMTVINCAIRIWYLHFRPGQVPTTTRSNYGWQWHRSRTSQDSGFIVFWVLALVWWNVARLLNVGAQFPVVSGLEEIIISVLNGFQLIFLTVSLRIAMANAKNTQTMPY